MIAAEKYNLKGISSFTAYASGEMKDCKLVEFNEIKVGNQRYVPEYKAGDARKRDNMAISFYEDGNIKSLALEERTEVSTVLGSIRAELVTFYEDGAFKSLFPLNGQVNFGWSEEEEEQLLEDMHFEFPFAGFTTKIIGVRFYNNGSLKSLILWPGKEIRISTPLGVYPVRIGFRLYEDGKLESFEPAVPVSINTAVGTVIAFDQNAVGIDADSNSVKFYPDSRLKSLSTNSDIVVTKISASRNTFIYRQSKPDMLTDEMVKVPVVISFHENQVTIDNTAEKHTFPIEDSKFLFIPDTGCMERKCGSCGNCSGCGAACM